jgi:integrase
MVKLVEGYAANLKVPPGERDVLAFDDALPGFFVRKFESGRASYGVKYQIGAQQRRLTLGAVVRGNLKAMRLEASAILAKARLGQDAVAEKRAQLGKRIVTLGELIPRYLHAREGDLRQKSLTEISRYLNRSWRALHASAIDTITRQTIVAVVDKMEHDSGPVAADRARTALSTFFSWAIDRGYIEINPTMHIRARAQGRARERTLSEMELVSLWRACHDDDHGRIVRLLILTGQRRAEIGDLSWSEVNIDKRQIELSAGRTKNGRPHIVPLSTLASAILKGTTRREGRDLVFGNGVGGFSGWSKAKSDLQRRLATLSEPSEPMEPWTLHDIRRSVVTHLNEHGFAQPHVVEAIVNHVSGHKVGVAGVYNRAVYAAEKCRAIELWSDHFEALVDGKAGVVVALRR